MNPQTHIDTAASRPEGGGHAQGRSLHRQLFLWLLLPQVVLWLAAALFTYNLTARYANEAIDASLSQASRALARQVRPTASGLYIDFPRSAQEIFEADPKDRVLYTVSSPPGLFLLGSPYLATPKIENPNFGEPYFYDDVYAESPREDAKATSTPLEPVRVAALYLHFGAEGARDGTMLVQVARSRANREQLARRIWVDTALPLSALIALMTVIVWAGVRAGLKPLSLLQRQVEGRSASDMTPFELESAPPEVRSLARALNALLEEVQHSVLVQKRFISDAAHQLRTPLAGLKSQTELALRDAKDPALASRLNRVHESANRSSHLVNQLLALARAEPESAMRQYRIALDLSHLAREVTADMVPRARAGGVDLGFDEPEAIEPSNDSHMAPCQVMGIPSLLKEALINVVDNAILYAGAGKRVTVRLKPQIDNNHCVLEVEDDGPGIPASELERVFERFVRATNGGSGCGLGLAIVREIVSRHGGTVSLHPVLPRGLTVRISLPTCRVQDSTPRQP